MPIKIDKKILVILLVVLLLLLIGSVGVYSYFFIGKNNNQDDAQKNPPKNSDFILENSEIEIEGSQSGGLIICADKCGDGICQTQQETKCAKLNCTCLEDALECPADCK